MMQEIASYKIAIQQPLQTKDILNIYEFAQQKDVNIYLYHKDAMADSRDLPKLLTFFLVNAHDEMLVIIEGKAAKQVHQQLQNVFQQHVMQTA